MTSRTERTDCSTSALRSMRTSLVLLARDFLSIALGTAPHTCLPLLSMGHFEVRWEYEQTRFSNMSARSVHPCEQKKVEAEARGNKIRCTSEVARKSGGHGAPKLAGRHHRDRDVLASQSRKTRAAEQLTLRRHIVSQDGSERRSRTRRREARTVS